MPDPGHIYDPGDATGLAIKIVNRDGSAVSAGGGGGTSMTDDAAFTPGTSSVTPIGALADETSPDSVDEGDVGAVRMTLARGLHVNIRDDAGDSVMDGPNNAVRVNIVAGSGSGTEYTEDAAAAANPTGSALILVRDDARSGSLTTADGDNVAARGTNAGELYVKHVDAIPVTDNGGSLTVDGTVAATQSGTWNVTNVSGTVSLPTGAATAANQSTVIGHLDGVETVLGTIDADTGNISTKIDTLAGAVSGAEMQVDIVSAPTLTVNAHAVTNAGTFAVQVDGAALTALQLIDNPVIVDDAPFTPGTSSVMMAGFEVDDTTPDSVNEGDAGAARMSANRNIYTQLRDAAGNERGANVNASNQLTVSVDNTVTVGSHAVTNAGTFAVQESGAALTALQVLDDWDESDRAKVNPIVGQAGVAAGEGAVAATVQRTTEAGHTPFYNLDVDESEDAIKASGGTLQGFVAINRTATPLFLKFYNATVANVTVGTTTPHITFMVPANADSDGAGFAWSVPIRFDTAITVAATTGFADNDTGAPGANDLIVSGAYD